MNPASFTYAAFVAAVALVAWATPPKARRVVVLLASFAFYATWGVPSLAPLAATLANARWIAPLAAPGARGRRVWLWIGIAINIAVLVGFRLASETVAGVEQLARGGDVGRFLVPAGLSFYIFQAISYLVDVSRGTVAARRNLVDVALFVSFFPHLLAGPLTRSRNFMRQVDRWAIKPDWEHIASGVELMAFGLFKKVVVSATIAGIVGRTPSGIVVADSTNASFWGLIAIAVTTRSIGFFDLSAYSDIARGAARVLGLELPLNVRQPLTRALTLTDYWRRHHITLMSWFRDYVYQPLRGPRATRSRLRRGLAIAAVFTLSAMWHGPSLRWGLFGLALGSWLVFENLTGTATLEARGWRAVAHTTKVWLVITFLGFVLSAPDVMAGIRAGGFLTTAPPAALAIGVVVAVACVILNDRFEESRDLRRRVGARWVDFAYPAMVVAAIAWSGAAEAGGFTYFRL